MNFNLAGQDLPPANAKKITDNHPGLSWGIILFDTLISNFDRHSENIFYDSSSQRVQIFDHSHAFIVGADVDSAKVDFERRSSSAGIGGHCLAETISSINGLKQWALRFSLIPDFYIIEVVNSAKTVGLSGDLADYATNFLLDRRTKLLHLITANRAQFPNLAPDLFDSLERGN
jgi:hypothetical protein